MSSLKHQAAFAFVFVLASCQPESGKASDKNKQALPALPKLELVEMLPALEAVAVAADAATLDEKRRREVGEFARACLHAKR